MGKVGDPSRPPNELENRAAKLLAEPPVKFVDNPCFQDPSPELLCQIVGPMPPGDDVLRLAEPKGQVEAHPYFAGLFMEAPLLTTEQETYLFRKMNFLKKKFIDLLKTVDPTCPVEETLNELGRLKRDWNQIQTHIVSANLRLVVSVVKSLKLLPKYRRCDFFEMVSDGNWTLISTVDQFDYARGTKFSTYAAQAIRRSMNTGSALNNVSPWAARSSTAEPLHSVPSYRSDERTALAEATSRYRLVYELLPCLNDRERRVIEARFGIGCEELSLAQLGKELGGLTRERVRQIESRALEKLLKAARSKSKSE
jgi:RNA polymerase sigma factor (sigma-70 family)